MSIRRRTLLALAGVAVAIATALLWGRGEGKATRAPHGERPASTAVPAPVQAGERSPSEAVAAQPRRAVDVLSQGLYGRVVLEGGAAVPAARLWLFAATPPSPFTALAMAQRGLVERPIGAAVASADGSFELPVGDEAIGRRLELRVVDDAHADLVRAALVPAPGDWRDLGELVLPRGVAVRGRVRDTAEQPIAGAVVTIQPGAGRAAVAPTPGREAGRNAVTDASGQWQIDGASLGIATFRAAAPGHATVELAQQTLFADEPNVLDFVLGPGATIRGIVVGSDGPLADAVVQAEADGAPRLSARTGADGRFAVDGLPSGSCRLRAAADGYQVTEVGPVSCDSLELRIVLAPQGGVRLSVQALGKVVGDYSATMCSHDAGSGALANLHGAPRRVRPPELRDGVLVWRGFDAGSYVMAVRADGFADSFSAPFEVEEAGSLVDVRVELRPGGALRGVLVGAGGEPLAGARVAALPAALVDNAATALLAPLLVFRGSQTSTVTGKDGSFVLEHLAAGDYQLRCDDAAHAPRWCAGLHVDDGATASLGTLALRRGVQLHGIATVDGEGRAQLCVEVRAQADGQAPSGFALEAATDAAGRWRLPRRLPAGRYELAAWRVADDSRFRADADRDATRTALELGEGDGERHVDVDIRSAARRR